MSRKQLQPCLAWLVPEARDEVGFSLASLSGTPRGRRTRERRPLVARPSPALGLLGRAFAMSPTGWLLRGAPERDW
jgi:hypothetical protein